MVSFTPLSRLTVNHQLIGGYRWLKYVPNGLLKTAQAADWKMQAWMIGKPPTIAYAGIGYTADSKQPLGRGSSPPNIHGVYLNANTAGRPSVGSFSSEYDDLRDFDGRFESRSTLGVGKLNSPPETKIKRKMSRGFLNRFKGSSSSRPPSPTEDKPPNTKKLKALRSMGSLKSRSPSLKKQDTPSPQLRNAFKFENEAGIEDWSQSVRSFDSSSSLHGESQYSTTGHRTNGRRSISFTATRPPMSLPSSPAPSSHTATFSSNARNETSYQAALGNALIAASHAESANGTHNDLLQILNHENHPWGFSYSSYPHHVKVWYGDKDEKIAENAVRWMEKNMGEEKCHVTVVKGCDHGMMYKSKVVVEVLEQISSYWSPCK